MRHKHADCQRSHLLTGLLSTLIFPCVMILLSGCTVAQHQRGQHESRFEFSLMGDMPYDAGQRKEFVHLMNQANSGDLAFVVHVGDFWFDGSGWKRNKKGFAPCSDEVFQDRLGLAQRSEHPFVFVPGDNDWTDCHRAKPESYDPLERLARLRKLFYPDNQSLGVHTMMLTRQSDQAGYARYRENVRWVYGNVLFVTLHMVGSNNNLGRTPEMDAEYDERNAANLAWMQEAFDEAKRNGNKAVMIIAHANPQFENTWPAKLQKRYLLEGLGIKPPETARETGFDDFLAALEEETLAYGKPVVYVHGDTHTFRIDKPLVGSISQRMIENFTRVEVFGYRNTHWIRVIVDPDDENVFSFRQAIVPENRVAH